MANGPDRQQLARCHHGDTCEPPRPVQQGGDQPQAQEIRLRCLLCRVLLEDEAGTRQHRRGQGDGDVHRCPAVVSGAARPFSE